MKTLEDDNKQRKIVIPIRNEQGDVITLKAHKGFYFPDNSDKENKFFPLERIAGYDKNQVKEKFSGMINALSYGAPPHGGIAPGIDRIIMLLADEKNIREVTLFPMNQNAEDLMMGAPSNVEQKQLKELNLKIDKKKTNS